MQSPDTDLGPAMLPLLCVWVLVTDDSTRHHSAPSLRAGTVPGEAVRAAAAPQPRPAGPGAMVGWHPQVYKPECGFKGGHFPFLTCRQLISKPFLY